jgi:hypothetical protein
VIAVGLIVLGIRWLWVTPLHHTHSKAPIGKLDLERADASLNVWFIAPEQLDAITILFPEPLVGSSNYCTSPDLPLALRVRVSSATVTNFFDDLISKDRMQWTSWHQGPSVLLMLKSWLGEHLSKGGEYDLMISVESPVDGIGQADVFLHWRDRKYIWGQEFQVLQITKRSAE